MTLLLFCGDSLELPQQGESNEFPQNMIWCKVRKLIIAGLHSAFSRASDFRFRGRKFESHLGLITVMEIFYGHSPLALIQEGQLSVTGKSMCAKYWLTTLRT